MLVAPAGKVLTHKVMLRQKIELAPETPQYILTEQGVGYRLKAPD